VPMSSFAKAQLLKYGWTEGKGLGKNENGIVDPLKPKLKFDTTGVGHDDKEHKWWESVYDKASGNIDIDTSAKNVSVRVRDEDAVEISTRKLDLRKLKKKHNLEYGSFLKTCTLDGGKVVPEENLASLKLDEVLHEAPSFELTDEQLFQACGGRTAHKGARHGLTLSGKLARIAQQEAELLGSPKPSTSKSATDEWTEVKKKKRKRRRSAADMDLETPIPKDSPEKDANANNLIVVESSSSIRSSSPAERRQSKTARRKEKRRFQDLVQKLNSVVIVDDSPEIQNETKKQKKKRNIEAIEKDPRARKRKSCEVDDEFGGRQPNSKKSCVSDIETLSKKQRSKDCFEADYLNFQIEKKKKKKRQAKTEKRNVARLSECLMAVNLCEDSVDSGRGEDLIESCENSKKLKKWKKHKKEKREKKIEEIVLD